MSTSQVILSAGILFILIPVMAYMIMKFGAAGYFRAKQRQRDEQQKRKGNNEIEE